MKIGIRNESLGADCLNAVRKGAQLGFDGVELDIGADYTGNPIWHDEGRRQLREAAADTGCEISSLCLGVLWQISPASDKSEVREEALKIITASAAFATELGAKWILLPITPGEDGANADQAPQRWIEIVAQAAPVAEDLGVVYCLENVGRGCGKSADDLQTLLSGLDSPAVGVYYDVGNAVAFGHSPVGEIKQLAEALEIVHIKDREADYLGEGVVPIPDCLKALQDIGYDDWLVLETPPTADPVEAGSRNLEYLRGLLATI